MILIKTDHVHRGRLFSGAVLLVTPENESHFPKNMIFPKKRRYTMRERYVIVVDG